MNNIMILEGVPLTTAWVAVVIPDRVRESVSFQLEDLGVGYFSLDGGITSMKFVGTGEKLTGNFSLRTMHFMCDEGEQVLQMRVQDGLYAR